MLSATENVLLYTYSGVISVIRWSHKPGSDVVDGSSWSSAMDQSACLLARSVPRRLHRLRLRLPRLLWSVAIVER